MAAVTKKQSFPPELEEVVERILSKNGYPISIYDVAFSGIPPEEDLRSIAKIMQNWMVILPALGIAFNDGKDIHNDMRKSDEEKRIEVLLKFLSIHGDDATYTKLLLAFFKEKRMILFQKVVLLAAARSQCGANDGYKSSFLQHEDHDTRRSRSPRKNKSEAKDQTSQHKMSRSRSRSPLKCQMRGNGHVDAISVAGPVTCQTSDIQEQEAEISPDCCGTVSKEIQLLKQHRSKLSKAVTFDMIWLAGQMNEKGFLSDTDHAEICDVRSLLRKEDKANILIQSVVDKVDLDVCNFHEFVEILKVKSKMFKEAIQLLACKSS